MPRELVDSAPLKQDGWITCTVCAEGGGCSGWMPVCMATVVVYGRLTSAPVAMTSAVCHVSVSPAAVVTLLAGTSTDDTLLEIR